MPGGGAAVFGEKVSAMIGSVWTSDATCHPPLPAMGGRPCEVGRPANGTGTPLQASPHGPPYRGHARSMRKLKSRHPMKRVRLLRRLKPGFRPVSRLFRGIA